MSISDELIGTEQVHLFDTLQLENRASHGTWILALTSACHGVSFRYIGYFIADIHDKVTLSCAILNHNLIIPSEFAVSRESPGHLSIRVLVLGKSLTEWKGILSFLSVIVGLLDTLKLVIFVPIANSSFVRILWAAL